MTTHLKDIVLRREKMDRKAMQPNIGLMSNQLRKLASDEDSNSKNTEVQKEAHKIDLRIENKYMDKINQ